MLIALTSAPVLAQQTSAQVKTALQGEALLNDELDSEALIQSICQRVEYSAKECEELHSYLEGEIRWARGKFIVLYTTNEAHESDVPRFFNIFEDRMVKDLVKNGKPHLHDHDHDNGTPKAPNGPCVNMDFETCDFTGWTLFDGIVNTNPMEMVNPVAATGTHHNITTPGTDPVVGIPTTSPNGGGCSVMLGDATGTGGRAASMTQTFMVSNANAVYTYSYALVLEDPSGHTTGEKPFFKVNMYDQGGAIIPCGEYSVIAGDVNSGGDPDFVAYAAGYYLPWRTTFAPLDAYIGQNVTVEFIVGDCSQSGHYGYGYVDAECSPLGIVASDSAICGNSSINLNAPPGAATYDWSTGESTEQIVVNTPGTYTVDITPVTGSGCAITLTITVTGSPGVPTADFTFAPNPACENELITFTDQSSATLGAIISSWDWDFGDGNTSTAQNPTHTYPTAGTYDVTLIATTQGGCSDTIVYPMVVNGIADATVTPEGPFCMSNPVVTMTAVDAGGTWTSTCGACINAATGDFDPATAGVGSHTITYTIAGMCGDTGTTVIDIQNVTLDNIVTADPLCALSCDGSITITATGANEYSIDNGATWQATGSFTNLCDGTYDCMVRNALGCSDTQQAILTDPAPLTMAFSAFDATCYGYCDGYAIVIPSGGTLPYTFNWSNGTPTNSAQSNGLCASTNSLTIVDGNGCSVDTLNWVINEMPPFLINNITTTDELCAGDCLGTIDIDAPGAVDFSIDNGSNFFATNVFNNQCAGTYDIVVQDTASCVATGQAVIGAANTVNIATGNDTIICIGGTANISAAANGGAGGFVYTWDNGLPSQSGQTVNPGSQTIYQVYATDANGCITMTMPVVVDLFPPLTVVALSDQAICYGEDAQISALAQGGNGGPYTYSWDQGLANGNSHIVGPNQTTVYTVTAADNCETPDDQAQVTITINPLPIPEFDVDNREGCLPVVSTFTNTTDPNLVGNSCYWNFGDGSAAVNDCGSPTHTFTEPGCYDVTLTVTSPDNCTADTTLDDYICVFDYPHADFSFGPQPTTYLEPEIDFTNWSTNPSPGFIIDYQWIFDELGTDDIENPTFEFPSQQEGTYEVCLTVTNNYGCIDDTCQIVVIDGEMLIYVPNAFTPDGDGLNDMFFARGLGLEKSTEFEMMIFNRWGELIHKSENPDVGWDGTKNGVKSKTDVYVWKIVVTNPFSNEKADYIGHVTLLR